MATDAQNLTAAKEALHKLATGQLARVFVDQNGERVEFTATNMERLERYIAKLEALVDPVTYSAGFRKPIRFTF